jgi:hypothetical protein
VIAGVMWMLLSAAAAADSTHDLDIGDRRITRERLEATTEVEAAVAGIFLRVGAAARAQRIDVRLQNVRGHVRFRGDVRAIQERLDRRARPVNQR